MASLVGRECYVDPADAATAFYSSAPPVLSAGQITSLELSGGVWSVVTRDSSGVVGSFSAPVPALADCNLSGRLADDAALASLVLIVWVTAWGVGYLRRVLAL